MTEPTRTIDLYNSGVFVEIDGIQVAQIDLPSGYVPYRFMPLLGTHTIISGDTLIDGMVVLVEPRFRADPEDLDGAPTSYDRRKIQETARWALVTGVSIQGTTLSFTAIYADGTMAERSHPKSAKWILLREYTFTGVGNPNACSYCGEVHDQEEARTVADNEADQLFYDVMDSGANLIGALLYPEASTKNERITLVKESLKGFNIDEFFDGFMEGLGDILGGVSEEEGIVDEAALAKDDFVKQPGTSIVDDFDQSTFRSEEERIEAEEAAAAERQRILDQEALDALRAKLRGDDRVSAPLFKNPRPVVTPVQP
jgi:hypothetical protein